ncbi:MAG: electron transport complex subunit RsxC [Clostridia bacterium]|nr:electron transport complex subunit RsxC [Clostridia bacterium]MBO7156897.1 electron transport complex subunit RsxC [Clostridia bacterium]
MRFKTFKYGIHPKDKKELSKDCLFEDMPTGEKVYIPLAQHLGTPASACVEVGDYVKVGTKIGEASGYVSCNVHSSVSGTVESFVLRENAMGKRIRHVCIANDGKYEEDFMPPLVNPTREEIIARCKDAGLAGMGGATFPTHVKLETKGEIKALIINGSECEPYITTDYRLMLDKPNEVMEGIRYIAKALDAKEIWIGIEANKEDAIRRMEEASANDQNVKVFELQTKYPQGGEKQLIYAITKRKVPMGGLPSDLGYIVLNISTSLAMYEACVLGKPLYSRYMTISGEGIERPANIYVRFGVPFSEIVEYLGYKEDIAKVISGGPMMGISLHSFIPVVTKGSSALLLLSEDEIRDVDPTPCINCARCANVCPMGLMPMMTDALIIANKVKETKAYHPLSCIECGCCAYVCPAKRPLVQSQRLAKKLIRERKL